MYHKGSQEEAFETTNISMMPLHTVMTMDQSDEFWQNMAPSAKGCVILYKLYTSNINQLS